MSALQAPDEGVDSMSLLEKFRLWRNYRRMKKAIEREAEMGFDVRKMLFKGLKALGVGAGAVACAAIGGWLADPVAVSAALEGDMPTPVLLAIVPILNACGEMLRNALKHKR